MTSGPVRFARYAYPPNALGYCGPSESAELFERAQTGADSAGLRRLVRSFEGAWPYLALIGVCTGRDPLDPAVVEAYWVGNALLDRVTARRLHTSMGDRFRHRLGDASWAGLDATFGAQARPHHGFHVFVIYPWVGLLRGGRVEEPLRVLDRCRIRWGQVVALDGTTAQVRFQPLLWDGRHLGLGPTRIETVRCVANVGVGDWCSLHWDWVCEVLDARGLAQLRHRTAQQLAVVNAAPAPAPALT